MVPNAYFDARSRSLTLTVSDPVGQEVQAPPCFAQNEQVQARAGISDGFGRQSSANEILPQWQRPEINMGSSAATSTPMRRIRSGCCARREGPCGCRAASLPPRGSGQGYHIGYAGTLEGELRHDRCATGRCLNQVNRGNPRRLEPSLLCPRKRNLTWRFAM